MSEEEHAALFQKGVCFLWISGIMWTVCMSLCFCAWVHLCVCSCVGERDRERARERRWFTCLWFFFFTLLEVLFTSLPTLPFHFPCLFCTHLTTVYKFIDRAILCMFMYCCCLFIFWWPGGLFYEEEPACQKCRWHLEGYLPRTWAVNPSRQYTLLVPN